MAEKSLVKQYARAALRIVQGLIEVVVHWLFGFVYGGPGQSMPPIKDLILLDSASTIAFKIRTRKVIKILHFGIAHNMSITKKLHCQIS